MKLRIVTTAAIGLALAASATAALAQTPAAPPAASVVVANPTYTSIHMEIDVNKSAADTWKAVGAKYCELGTWLRVPCQITAGQDGQIGAVRTIAGRVIEVLVGKTDLSYTYVQPVGNRPYDLYHGTLEAKPTGPNKSKLVYTLFYDNSTQADKERDRATRTAQFNGALQNMKVLAETGAMPPAPPRPAPPAAAPAAK